MTHILIVEDDLPFGTMMQTWLKKKGFETSRATSVGAAARLLTDGTKPDLVLSDLRLPDHDGLFLLGWMRKRGHNAPFIVMTNYAEVQNAVLAMKLGAADYIAKPVQPDILLQKIRTHWRRLPTRQQQLMPLPRPLQHHTKALTALQTRTMRPKPGTVLTCQDTLRARARPQSSFTAMCSSSHPHPCRCSFLEQAARARNMWHGAFMG